MTKPIITVHNVQTGEVEVREMNAEELSQLEANKVAGDAVKAQELATELARQAILDRLGLTADEAALLLGAN